MIATLRGRIEARSDDSLIVAVGGIGFRVRVPTPLLAEIGGIGSPIELFTHLHVREDELSLYGFASADELALFELLLTVPGVGPRVALGMLSAGSTDMLRLAIAQGNVEALTQIPGIGKKMAQKLILELKGKIELAGLPPIPELAPADAEIIAALTALGYSVAEAQRACAALPADVTTIEDKVRAALQYLGRT
jgi:Holliday junction DNA helicase RuvA